MRRDLPGSPSVSPRAQHVQATAHATTLGGEAFSVSTVEHCLSAVAALRIDNLLMELEGPEIPICDGSALQYFQALKSVGCVEQSEPRKYLIVDQPIYCGDAEKHAYVLPYQGFKVTCSIVFPHPAIGRQSYELDVTEASFLSGVAPARTFGFLKDVEALRARGLALGGSLENAVVLDETRVLNEEGLRFSDEFVRHKVLDAIGDMMTLGMPMLGHLVLYKAGHDLMNRLVQKIMVSQDCFRIVDLGGSAPKQVIDLQSL